MSTSQIGDRARTWWTNRLHRRTPGPSGRPQVTFSFSSIATGAANFLRAPDEYAAGCRAFVAATFGQPMTRTGSGVRSGTGSGGPGGAQAHGRAAVWVGQGGTAQGRSGACCVMAGLLGRPIAVNENDGRGGGPTARALDKLFFKDGLRVQHSVRFRKVADGYPRRVAFAYDRDFVQAALDTDEQVAATVAEWSGQRAGGPGLDRCRPQGTRRGRGLTASPRPRAGAREATAHPAPR